MAWFVVVPYIYGHTDRQDIDCDYNFPMIKRGVFVKCLTAEEALDKAVKQLGYSKTTFAVMEFKPTMLASFNAPTTVLKEINSNGEVLPA